MYHYKESGLDNIFLVNGYRRHRTRYGEGFSIADTAGLHTAIGRWLINSPKPLNGAGLRFLRLEMEITQRNLAALVGTTEQSLRLWEKHRKKVLPGSADRLVRAIYSEYIGSANSVRRMLDRLAELDEMPTIRRTNFCHWDSGWKPAASTAANR
jgi:DNA-binding transcriptional regulator YiaG